MHGFEDRFDPTGLLVDPSELDGLDPVFTWLLHAGHAALTDADLEPHALAAADGPVVGAVVGNLSFPSRSMAAFADEVWRGGAGHVDPRNRFSSGLPALLLRRALGLRGGSFAIDAACASALYAIGDACERLAGREVDVMLAGAVNAADDLFIHAGFTALSLSLIHI